LASIAKVELALPDETDLEENSIQELPSRGLFLGKPRVVP